MNALDPKKIYVPILKAKTGELSALGDLEAATKKQIVPLFEIPHVQWDFVDEKPSETAEKLIGRVVTYVEKYWKKNPFFLDVYGDTVLSTYEPEANVVDILAKAIEEKDLDFTPVICFNYTLQYNKSVIDKLANGKGVALRVNYDPEDENDYDVFLKDLGLEPSQVDLILDLGSVNGDKEEAVYLASRLILSTTPHIQDWRNLILAASSFPKSVGGAVEKNSQKVFERSEWLGWSKLAKYENLSRLPVFADYSISHPEVFDDLDPRLMKISGSIRYTAEKGWLVVKGEKLIGDGAKGFGQYRELSEKVIKSGNFHGEDASWGDKYIFDCAAGSAKTGNLTTWRRVGNNQHFEYVIQQLAMLSESA